MCITRLCAKYEHALILAAFNLEMYLFIYLVYFGMSIFDDIHCCLKIWGRLLTPIFPSTESK